MALRTAAGVSLMYIVLPMAFVIWLAFFAQEIPSFPPEGYSLRWFRTILGNVSDTSSYMYNWWESLSSL